MCCGLKKATESSKRWSYRTVYHGFGSYIQCAGVSPGFLFFSVMYIKGSGLYMLLQIAYWCSKMRLYRERSDGNLPGMSWYITGVVHVGVGPRPHGGLYLPDRSPKCRRNRFSWTNNDRLIYWRRLMDFFCAENIPYMTSTPSSANAFKNFLIRIEVLRVDVC